MALFFSGWVDMYDGMVWLDSAKKVLTAPLAIGVGVFIGGAVYHLLSNVPSDDVKVLFYALNPIISVMSGLIVIIGLLMLQTAMDTKELDDRIKKMEGGNGE